jgi:hypothetical protein
MTQDLETGFAEFGVKVCGGEEPSHALYAYDPDGRMLGVYTDAGAEAFLALLRSIRRPPVVGGELREKVAATIYEAVKHVFENLEEPTSADYLPAVDAILSLPGIAAGEGWQWLADNTSLSLEFGYPRDIEGEPGRWEVHRVTGNINDREWELVGTGDTPLAAVLAARAAISKALGKDEQ